jgi:predicted nucleic acid-binding protein
VLQEFFVTTTQKIPKPLNNPATARIIDDLAHWHVHAPAAGDVLAAIDIHQRTGASFWDAMILRSAKELGCGTLHSEDLNPGQAYETFVPALVHFGPGLSAGRRVTLARQEGAGEHDA